MSGAPHLPRGGRVAVVGAINVDCVVVAEHLPAPGETVVGSGVRRYGGGKGANAAVAAARAGASVCFLGAVGTDSEGELAECELNDEGVDCSAIARLVDHPTGVALIVVDPAGENQIAVGAGANLALDPDWVASCVVRMAADLDCVLISTEIPGVTVVAAVAAAARAGLTCLLNPAPPIEVVCELLDHHPILTLNRGELRTLLALLAARHPELVASIDEDAIDGQALALARITGAAVCVTLGGEGVLMVSGERVDHLPAPTVEVQDATGAGDTFNGVLAAQLAAGSPLESAARAATLAASLSVATAGARSGMPDLEAIERGSHLVPRAYRADGGLSTRS